MPHATVKAADYRPPPSSTKQTSRSTPTRLSVGTNCARGPPDARRRLQVQTKTAAKQAAVRTSPLRPTRSAWLGARGTPACLWSGACGGWIVETHTSAAPRMRLRPASTDPTSQAVSETADPWVRDRGRSPRRLGAFVVWSAGISARMRVPAPGGLSTSRRRSSASTRSASPRMPLPRLESLRRCRHRRSQRHVSVLAGDPYARDRRLRVLCDVGQGFSHEVIGGRPQPGRQPLFGKASELDGQSGAACETLERSSQASLAQDSGMEPRASSRNSLRAAAYLPHGPAWTRTRI